MIRATGSKSEGCLFESHIGHTPTQEFDTNSMGMSSHRPRFIHLRMRLSGRLGDMTHCGWRVIHLRMRLSGRLGDMTHCGCLGTECRRCWWCPGLALSSSSKTKDGPVMSTNVGLQTALCTALALQNIEYQPCWTRQNIKTISMNQLWSKYK